MARIGFCDGFYESQAVNADCQVAINCYPEPIESGMGQTSMALYGSPGTKPFANLAGMRAVRKEFTFAGRFFAIAEDLGQQYLWEAFAAGAPVNYGPLGPVGGACSMEANNAKQLLVCSSGRLFIFLMKTNALSELDTTSGNLLIGKVARVGFSDGFFVALIANSQTLQVSALLNGTATGWSPLNFTTVSVYADNVLAMLIDHREVWLWGPKKTVPYFDAGAPIFPYLPVPGGFIEQGIVAPDSPVKLDNSVFWLGGDERGSGIAWRAQGYLPTRVSTYALENKWQKYPTIADAIGYSYQDSGHSFWHLLFPSAQKSWRYDVGVGKWHEVAYWNAGTFEAHHSQCHEFAFGKHLVGDTKSGTIFEMTGSAYTDNGNPIRRVRRGPPVSSEQEYIFIHKFEVYAETGLGPEPPLVDSQNNPRNPQFDFRQSKDGGHTWSDPISMDCGQSGEFRKRMNVRRLGRARSWVPEISTSDPVPFRIVDAYLKSTPDLQPKKRLAKQYAEIA